VLVTSSSPRRPRRARRGRTARHDSRGFTLVELTIALGLLLIVVGAMYDQLSSAQRSEHFASDRSFVLDQTRESMARMTLDIRQAVSVDPSSTDTHMLLQTYVNGTLTFVTYDISGTTLTRTVQGRPAEQLQTDLADTSIFSYDPDASDAQVVSILLQVTPPASPNATIQLTSEARLRNIDPG
jgi:prepilin-type N-terminal cleavage/methylation domain-containing protein